MKKKAQEKSPKFIKWRTKEKTNKRKSEKMEKRAKFQQAETNIIKEQSMSGKKI